MRSVKVFQILVVAVFAFALPLSSHAENLAKSADQGDSIPSLAGSGYVAKNEPVQSLFTALSGELRKPIVLSKQAQKKTISGNFDFSKPVQFLDKFCSQIGLVWYDDGQSVYVYENTELKSAVVSMHNSSLETLTEFLQKTGLATRRYPIRGDPKTNSFYVSGPPTYVDIVVNASNYLDELYKNVDLSKQRISVIKLQHTFVGDRTFKLRDQQINIAGIGKVIDAILSSDQKELVSITELGKKKVLEGEMSPGTSPLESKNEKVNSSQIKIIPYPETNSILVKGTYDQIELIKTLIAQLDVPRRHIELSLWIIDVTRTGLDQLGINWQGAITIGNKAGITVNTTNSYSPGSVSTLDGSRFLANILALSQKGIAQVVSRPIILTQDNVPSLFDHNNTFYTKLEAERVASLESVSYGTLISVLPRFSTEGDDIEMVLDIEDGQQTMSGAGSMIDGMPVITRTQISTVARVPKDKSLLIGGYTLDQRSQTDSKIPVLGDLPLVGGLFSSKIENNQEVVRIFLIQPKLLDLGSSTSIENFISPPMLAPDLPLDDVVDSIRSKTSVK